MFYWMVQTPHAITALTGNFFRKDHQNLMIKKAILTLKKKEGHCLDQGKRNRKWENYYIPLKWVWVGLCPLSLPHHISITKLCHLPPPMSDKIYAGVTSWTRLATGKGIFYQDLPISCIYGFFSRSMFSNVISFEKMFLIPFLPWVSVVCLWCLSNFI